MFPNSAWSDCKLEQILNILSRPDKVYINAYKDEDYINFEKILTEHSSLTTEERKKFLAEHRPFRCYPAAAKAELLNWFSHYVKYNNMIFLQQLEEKIILYSCSSELFVNERDPLWAKFNMLGLQETQVVVPIICTTPVMESIKGLLKNERVNQLKTTNASFYDVKNKEISNLLTPEFEDSDDAEDTDEENDEEEIIVNIDTPIFPVPQSKHMCCFLGCALSSCRMIQIECRANLLSRL